MAASPLPRIALLFATLLALAPAQAAAPADDVLAAEAARRTALLSGDVGALDQLLADDLRYIHSNGKVETKRDVLAGFASGTVAFERFDLAALHAHVLNAETVAVDGRVEQRKRTGPRTAEQQLLFHAVWRRDGGRWRLVSLQTAAPPAAPAAPKKS
jgi:ketosteroid isomerase-like protein